ncbi:uncharacterized protein TNCV_4059971 [Trichonephila clavipes]|nr:uncharacterized protein TNCV_4059971 [Trichonephila clavipes]
MVLFDLVSSIKWADIENYAVAVSTIQVTVRFGSVPPQFRGRTLWGGQRPPASLLLPPTSRDDLRLDGYLEYPPAMKALYIYKHPCLLRDSNPVPTVQQSASLTTIPDGQQQTRSRRVANSDEIPPCKGKARESCAQYFHKSFVVPDLYMASEESGDITAFWDTVVVLVAILIWQKKRDSANGSRNCGYRFWSVLAIKDLLQWSVSGVRSSFSALNPAISILRPTEAF